MIGLEAQKIGHLLLIGLAFCVTTPPLAWAVEMVNDPKGFQNIAWGSLLSSRPDIEMTRAGAHVNEYRLKNGEASFAGVSVESVRFLTVEDQFARVTIRYRGDQANKEILAYLEQQFGRLDRLPGQMMRGLNQQYNWRGTDTEINVTYHANTEKGFIFIDSRTLAPRFNDLLGDTVD